MCRSYSGSNCTNRGGLKILGGRKNLGGLLDCVGVEYGQRNLGVYRILSCTVHVVCFSGVYIGFVGSVALGQSKLGCFLDSVGVGSNSNLVDM